MQQNDLIRRMAVVSAIKSYEIEKCPEYMHDWATKLKRAILDDIVDDVMALPAVEIEPKWIPVTERLPDNRGDVLVVAYWHETWQTMTGWYSEILKMWRVITPRGERTPGGVTHWMPLPEPPKGD